MEHKDQTHRLTLLVPPRLMQAVEREAGRREQTISEFVRGVLRERVAGDEQATARRIV